MVPLHKVYMPDDINLEISEVLSSGNLGYGSYSKSFEKKIREFIGNELTIAISGNSVLFALKLLDIKEGDEIIASPMSCLMTTQPAAICNANIIWADIDPKTGTLDPDDIKSKLTSKTKAIIHYHWAGYPGHIDEINLIGRENGVKVIEEAGMAFGSEYKYNNKFYKVGSCKHVDISTFSLHPLKTITSGEGGIVTTNNSKISKNIKLFRSHGIIRNRKKYWQYY